MTKTDLEPQLKKYETEFARFKSLFMADGVITSEEQLQLDNIERIIGSIRTKLGAADTGTNSQEDNLSSEGKDAKKYATAWDTALNEVSNQVASIRKAMTPTRAHPNVAAIYDALGAYDGMDNVRREFPDLDLAKLLAAAGDNDRQLYEKTLQQTAKEVGQARRELTELRPILNALDDNPYGVKTNADDIVTRVLEEIASGLGV